MAWVPPTFWRDNNIWAKALTPASLLYGRIQSTLYNSRAPYKSKLPILCVGNVQLGGSGKTPIVQALYKLITSAGLAHNPVILLRGYGGSLKGPMLVDLSSHTAKDVGDEALLHAHYAPTIIARNRHAGARLAEQNGHDLIIMDDGLQNNQLSKTFSLLVFNTEQGLGNELTFPAGPLREPLQSALDKAQAVLQIGPALPFVTMLPLYSAHIQAPIAPDPAMPYLAFCGIGQPEKFYATLKQHHYSVIDTVSFADHQSYTTRMLTDLTDRARETGARLITTEKDAMRLPSEWRIHTDILKIHYMIDQPDALLSQIKEVIQR